MKEHTRQDSSIIAIISTLIFILVLALFGMSVQAGNLPGPDQVSQTGADTEHLLKEIPLSGVFADYGVWNTHAMPVGADPSEFFDARRKTRCHVDPSRTVDIGSRYTDPKDCQHGGTRPADSFAGAVLIPGNSPLLRKLRKASRSL